MTKKPGRQKGEQAEAHTAPRRTRKSVWDDAEVVVNIEYTKPGTALDDHLRREQTRAVLDLLADYIRKLDRDGEIAP